MRQAHALGLDTEGSSCLALGVVSFSSARPSAPCPAQVSCGHSQSWVLQTKKVKDYIRFLSRNYARIKQDKIFKMLKEKKTHQPRNLYPEKLSFRREGEIKAFSDKT